MQRNPPPRHLILVGMMGAGKTAVGKVCAQLLGRAFVDTDDVVEAQARASVAEIFASEGEDSFRHLERRAVADVCSSSEPLVIACGGGAVLDPENRRRLREAGFVVWLTAPVEVLAARVADGSGRPLLAGAGAGAGARPTLTRLLADRQDAYRDASDDVVATDGRPIEDVAGDVLATFAISKEPGR